MESMETSRLQIERPCLACLPETFLEDRLGGSSGPGEQRMHIEQRWLSALLRLYVSFEGETAAFGLLCDRIRMQQELVYAASDREPHHELP